MASLNVLVKFLTSSPFRLSLWRSSLPFCLLSLFPSSSISSLGYARGNYLVLQPRFYRLPRVRHSVRSHIFSRSVFSALFPFCLQYFLSFILCFGCISFQSFPCYSFSAAAPGISVLQGSLIPCRITGGYFGCYPSSRVFSYIVLTVSLNLSGCNSLVSSIISF